ncbi:MAG: c-type cytochrome [Hyphomicrobium sp.]
MRTLRKMYFILCLFIWPLQPAFSNDGIGDPRQGLDYAKRNCSSCHAVQKGDTNSPNPKSAPFSVIAQTAGITRISLGVFLQTSHSTMPNLIVKGEEADNLISYILSLKESKSR